MPAARASMPAIWRSRSSIIATLASTPSRHGSGKSRRASSSRPWRPKRSETGQRCPKASSWAWTRCFSELRLRTKNSRQRARSRSARSSKLGSQIAGTRSRRESSASTHASMRSVLHANGPRPLTFCASATSTSQPQRSSVSCTNRAPFIDSIAARTAAEARDATRRAARTRAAHRRPAAPRRPQPDRPLIEQAIVQPPATEIQSSVQHEDGPPSELAPSVNTPERATAGGPPS